MALDASQRINVTANMLNQSGSKAAGAKDFTKTSREENTDIKNLLEEDNAQNSLTSFTVGNLDKKQAQFKSQIMSKAGQSSEETMEQEIDNLLIGKENFEDNVMLSISKKVSARASDARQATSEETEGDQLNGSSTSSTEGLLQEAVNTATSKTRLEKKRNEEKNADIEQESEETTKSEGSKLVSQNTTQKKLLEKRKLDQQRVQRHGQKKDEKEQANLKENVKNYAIAFTSSRLRKTPGKKNELDELRQKLRSGGLTNKEVLHLEQNALKNVHSQLKDQIKDAYLKQYLIEDKDENGKSANLKSKYNLAGLFSELKNSPDFNEANINQMFSGADSEVFKEVRDLVGELLEEKMFQSVKGDGDNQKLEKEIEKLKGFASEFYVNMSRVEEQAKVKAYDLGYMLFEQGQGDGDSNKNKKNREQFEMTEVDEKDIFLDRIRSLYLRRAVNGDARTQIETFFQIRKARKGLVQLGVYNKDIEKDLEEEARQMAVGKLKDMLFEALLERATFQKLSGNIYKNNEKKVKAITRNLEKLSEPISKNQFNTIRDKANREMYNILKIDLQKIDLKDKETPNMPHITQRKKVFMETIARLMDETPINDSLEGGLQEELDHIISGITKISSDA